MSKKIILMGGYGGHDIGDEAMLTTDLINLKKFIPDAQFLALSYDPEYTSGYHKIESDYWIDRYLSGYSTGRKTQPSIVLRILKFPFNFSMRLLRMLDILFNAWILKKYNRTIFLNEEGKRLLNHLKSADLLFNVGGGNINSMMCKPWCLCPRFIVYLICKIFGKPVIVSGQTIGPIDDKWTNKKVAGFFLNKVDVITLRDVGTSMSILKNMGVTKPIIKETTDDAFLLPPISQEKVMDIFLDEKIEVDHPLIGVNMCGFLSHVISPDFHENIQKAKQILAQALDRLISELGARIVFIPMDYAASSSDRVAASDVFKLMEHKDSANIIMNSEYDDRTLKAIIGQMDLVVGSRHHFVVFATTMQVPTIGIYLGEYYKMKIGGILELMGQEKYALDFEKTSAEEIVDLVKDALQNKDKIKKKLEERTKLLGERSLFTIEYAAKLLKGEV